MPLDEPYVPAYEHNVFISYAWADNKAGWVTALDAFLDRRLGELLGRKARVWRDAHETDPGDVLAERLAAEIARSAVFVTVLTPSFRNSPYCLAEVQRFRAQPERVVGQSSRWIRVVKTPDDDAPADGDLLAAALREEGETIEARFVEEEQGGRQREFAAGSPEFDAQAERLAQSIVRLLKKMRRRSTPPPDPRAPRVFLAWTTRERREDREFIRADLQADLAHVIAEPAAEAMTEAGALAAEVEAALEGCALSIHVLDARYGLIPEGEASRSVPRLQLALAAGVHRLVWIPDTLANIEPAQQAFIDEITALADPRLEVLRTGRQAFLEHVRDVLRRLAAPPVEPAPDRGVYVVSEYGDLEDEALHTLYDCLDGLGYYVEHATYKGTEQELQDDERIALQQTDATIIYYGNAPDRWVKAKRSEILKTLGELKLASMHARAVYLSEPETPPKHGIYMGRNGVMRERGGPPLFILGDCRAVDCSKLAPLLQRIGGRAGV